MKTKTIYVTSRNPPGVKRQAKMAICEYCDGDAFHLFDLGRHQHLQCAKCDKTFCDGGCEDML